METKRCCLCKEIKPISEFYNNKRRKDGKAPRCKFCHFKFAKRLPARSEWKTTTLKGDIKPDQRFGRLTALYSVGKDELRRTVWVFRCDCGNEKELPVSRVANGRYPDVSCGCQHKMIADIDANYKYSIAQYKYGAESRGYCWELSDTQVSRFFAMNCYYCGASPSITVSFFKTADVFVRNGIDRLNPADGYTMTNCVACCTRCNYAKGTMTHQEFIDFIKIVYEKLISK